MNVGTSCHPARHEKRSGLRSGPFGQAAGGAGAPGQSCGADLAAGLTAAQGGRGADALTTCPERLGWRAD